MKDDLLERAVASYRDQTGDAGDRSDAVLERIQRSHRTTHLVGGKRRRVLAITLAAALATVGAWAGVSKRLPALVARVAAFVGADREEARPGVSRHVRAVPPAIAVLPTPAPSVPDVETPAKEDKPTVVSRPRAAAPAPTPQPVPTTSVVAAARDVDALYRAAHDAHFKTHDYAAALAAWDAYLAAAGPGSAMLIEARYNRGIALARLGRRDEAVAALRPFAEGEYGEYRKADARRLIEKLER